MIEADGKNVVPDVWAVLDKIKAFSDKVCLPAPPRPQGPNCVSCSLLAAVIRTAGDFIGT